MAGQQRRLAHAAKRDSQSMKTLSLLGAIFLPATYLASVFSMSFFDFNDNDPTIIINPPGDNGSVLDVNVSEGGDGPKVSSSLWIYVVFTVPLTLFIVVTWWWWDKRRERKFAEEDVDIQTGIDDMEAQIMASMRQRTLSKVKTWDLSKAE
jgi:hypothetical protein